MNDETGQIEATPTSPEPQAPDEPQQPEVEPQEEPQDTQQEDQEEPQEEATQTQDELPIKERTRERIEELAKGKKSAEEALEDLKKRKSVFDEFLPEQQGQPEQPIQQEPPKQQTVDQFIDDQGNVDVQGLNDAPKNATQMGTMGYQQAQQAIQYAQQVDRRNQEREAYTKYPELNPISEEHDDDFKQLVAAQMAMNWAKGENKTLIEVADFVHERYAKRQTEEAVAKKAVEQYKEAQSNRDQGPMEKGRGAGRSDVTKERLKEISLKGDPDQQAAAIAERLKRANLG